MQDIINISKSFIYQVNVSGVTGVKDAKDKDVDNFVKRLKKLTDIPICSGFGIKTPEQAAEHLRSLSDKHYLVERKN